MKHKWWHFVYGVNEINRVVLKTDHTETMEFWSECRKCGEMVGEKSAGTFFDIGTIEL